MIQLFDQTTVIDGAQVLAVDEARARGVDPDAARAHTLTHRILAAHNAAPAGDAGLRLRFDALASHDITYVGIIQTARASGLTEFPVPYALTNCHNSLCAVGGTINEDDHLFGLSAAKKYGGIFVPPHLAVIHQYVREMMTKCGGMILGSDSHTRYGALGVMGVGEGGPELVKQLLGKTYDVPAPKVVAVWLEGTPAPGVGPQDVALAIIGAVFKNGFVKNKVMEFIGPGIDGLSVEYRCGIDVMTTETTCLSSIWRTDDKVRQYLALHKREQDFAELALQGPACYDGLIRVDLGKIEPMIALPFHPSNVWPVAEVVRRADEILAAVDEEAVKQFGEAGKSLNLRGKIREGGVWVDQGIIAGCAGGMFDNIDEAAQILRGGSVGSGYFSMSVYPTSVPVSLALTRLGVTESLLETGAIIKPSFCGPCFGAGDVPANNGLSLRHTTRNFPNREGSKPGEGQFAGVCLMDARSIAATARNGGRITPADELDYTPERHPYQFDKTVYARRVYNGFGHPQPETKLIMGPNITDWPRMYELGEHLLLELAAVIHDPVTTTDELIPSGETSSYRSNPLRLAEFTLSRRVPDYVPRAKEIAAKEAERREGSNPSDILAALSRVGDAEALLNTTQFGSCVFANKPGDGSAREQAASCQKVLGGLANICYEFATKRYRSNCINWGMLPFTLDAGTPFDYAPGDLVFVPDVRKRLEKGCEDFPAEVLRQTGEKAELLLHVKGLTPDERDILLDGCLMNYYAKRG